MGGVSHADKIIDGWGKHSLQWPHQASTFASCVSSVALARE